MNIRAYIVLVGRSCGSVVISAGAIYVSSSVYATCATIIRCLRSLGQGKE
jgi:hypothetical protein